MPPIRHRLDLKDLVQEFQKLSFQPHSPFLLHSHLHFRSCWHQILLLPSSSPSHSSVTIIGTSHPNRSVQLTAIQEPQNCSAVRLLRDDLLLRLAPIQLHNVLHPVRPCPWLRVRKKAMRTRRRGALMIGRYVRIERGYGIVRTTILIQNTWVGGGRASVAKTSIVDSFRVVRTVYTMSQREHLRSPSKRENVDSAFITPYTHFPLVRPKRHSVNLSLIRTPPQLLNPCASSSVPYSNQCPFRRCCSN